MIDVETVTRKPEKYRLCGSYRLFISFMGFFAFFNSSYVRIGIVMALVCMSKPHERNRTEADPYCPDLGQTRSNEKYEFDWSSQLQGVILSGGFYGFFLGPLVSGFLSYKFGGKIMLVIGTLFAGLLQALIPETTRINPYFFFVIRIICGFFGGLIVPAYLDVLPRWCAPEERQILIVGALSGIPSFSIINFPLNGFICATLSWDWIFYFSTLWLLFWALIYSFFVFDVPKKCRYASKKEIKFLEDVTTVNSERIKVPWKQILKSIPVYSYMLTHFCMSYGFLTIMMSLPIFMKDVHRFNLGTNSLLSASPYVGSLICRVIMTYAFTPMKNKLRVTTNCLRKSNVFLGIFVSSTVLIAIPQLTCRHRYLALGCFIVFTTTLELSLSGGYLLSLLDMCPRYNNILSGIANSLGNVAGLLGALMAGSFTPNGSLEEWRTVFYTVVGFLTVAGLSYVILGTSEQQPWGLPKRPAVDPNGENSEVQKSHASIT